MKRKTSKTRHFKRYLELQPSLLYNEDYIKLLREKGKKWLTSLDPDKWLKEIRGGPDDCINE